LLTVSLRPGRHHKVLAEGHPLMRAGIRATLAAEPDMALVGEAVDGREAQRLCQEGAQP